MIDYKKEDAVIIEIGANEARFLLNLNSKNRRPKNNKIAEYTSVIENNEFKFNGASIVVSKDGVLLDGQHRLMALEKLNTYRIKTVLVTGVSNDTMGTIDIGSKRTNSDFLSIGGVKNSTALASMVRNTMEQFGNNKSYAMGKRSDRKSETKIQIAYTPSQVIEYFERYKNDFEESLEFSEHLYRNGTKIKGLSVATIGAFHILLSREDKQASKNFLREVLTGISHSESNAGIFLRNKLLDITIKKTRITIQELRNLIIYSFRKYKEGINVKRLPKDSQIFAQLAVD